MQGRDDEKVKRHATRFASGRLPELGMTLTLVKTILELACRVAHSPRAPRCPSCTRQENSSKPKP